MAGLGIESKRIILGHALEQQSGLHFVATPRKLGSAPSGCCQRWRGPSGPTALQLQKARALPRRLRAASGRPWQERTPTFSKLQLCYSAPRASWSCRKCRAASRPCSRMRRSSSCAALGAAQGEHPELLLCCLLFSLFLSLFAFWVSLGFRYRVWISKLSPSRVWILANGFCPLYALGITSALAELRQEPAQETLWQPKSRKAKRQELPEAVREPKPKQPS